MNIQILPNWFKKVAVVVFLVTSFISAGDDFINGFRAGAGQTSFNYEQSKIEGSHIISIFVGGEKALHVYGIISILAILAYMLTKEKVEDEYINILRLQSYQLAFLFLAVMGLLLVVFNKAFFYGIDDSIIIFLWLYLIIFYFKKRINL